MITDVLRRILSRASDASLDWDARDLPPEPTEIHTDAEPSIYDHEGIAAGVRYASGAVKRTRYPRVRLARRRVCVVLHQTGFVRGPQRTHETAQNVTCHRLVGPDGSRYRVHPIDVRIVCSNRLDRAPYHAIGIEVIGNYAGGADGATYWRPDQFGRSTLRGVQATAIHAEITALVAEVAAAGGRVEFVAPHIVSGRSEGGRPNRPLCCGPEIWAVGEQAAQDYGLRVPGPTQTWGGLPIYPSWYSDARSGLALRGLVGVP